MMVCRVDITIKWLPHRLVQTKTHVISLCRAYYMYTVLTYHQEHMRGNLLQVELKIYRRTFINQKHSDSLVTRAPDRPSSSMSTKKEQKRAQTKRVGQKSRRRRQESRPLVRDRAIIGIHRVWEDHHRIHRP